jgi:hypothetical protein
VRAHKQAGHMDASDLIKVLQNTLRGGGRPHMEYGPTEILASVRALPTGACASLPTAPLPGSAHRPEKPGFSISAGEFR